MSAGRRSWRTFLGGSPPGARRQTLVPTFTWYDVAEVGKWQSHLSYLLGSWSDDSRTGEPGTATASGESWHEELGGRLYVRKGWCEFPATPRRPAFRHEDRLIVYADGGPKLHGIFWDTDDHVIEYRDVHVDPEGRGVRFASEPSASSPRQQLEYRFERPDHFSATFALRLPGAADFSPYLRWHAGRATTIPK